MNVKRLAGLVVLVVATAALADWWPLSVPGVPRDVEIADAGHFAIALTPSASVTALEVVLLPDGGTVFPASSSVARVENAYLYADGGSFCLSTINQSGVYAGCNEGYNILMTGTVRRARHSATGGAYVSACSGFFAQILYAPNTHGVSPPYNGPSSSFTCFDPVAALQLGGVDYGLFGLGDQGGSTQVALYQGISPVGAPARLNGVVNIRDVALFGAGAQPVGLVAGQEGLELLTFTPDAGSSEVSNAGWTNLTGVAFATGTGDSLRGDGFGMVVAQLDGGAGAPDAGVFSAIPNPNSPAMNWVRNTRPLPGNLAGPLRRVMCHGAEFCVLLTDRPDGGGPNVVLYNNAHSPTFTVDGGRVPAFDEGAGGTVVADVMDDDGDAVYVTWDPVDAGVPLILMPDPSSIDGRTLQVSTVANSPLLCGKSFEDFYLVARASDGLSGHLSSQSLPIRVRRIFGPPAPTVTPASWEVDAGAGPVTFQAMAASSCPTQIVWSEVGDAGFAWSATPSGRLTVQPPPVVCNFRGITATYAAQAVEVGDGGPASDAGIVTLKVDPWGAPDAAFPPGYAVIQDGGAVAQYFPLALHECPADTLNFPGIETTWTLDARGLDASIGPPGGSRGPGPVVGDSVELWVPDCALDGGVTLFTTNKVMASPYQELTSSVDVRIRTVLQPIASPSGAPMLMLDGYDAMTGTVSGTVSTGLNCPRERGLTAALSVTGPSGALLADQVPVAVPGPFALQLDGGCEGGTFELIGFLSENGGARSPVTRIPFTGGTRAVAIDRISPGNVPATCEGVNGQLQVQLAATSCPTGSFAWEQTGGPPVEVAVRGSEATVTSRDAGLNELVGQHLSFHVSASAGPGTDAGLDTSVQIVAEPFVKVTHRTELPVSSESGVTGVAVRLVNQATCPVSGVSFMESLDGLKFLPGTARVAGQSVEATLSGDELVFSDLELPAGGSVELSFMARPRLLSAPKPSGQAFLRGVPVSERAGLDSAPPPSGCGCSGGPGELAAYALAALGLLLRRRSVRTRS